MSVISSAKANQTANRVPIPPVPARYVAAENFITKFGKCFVAGALR